MRIEVYKNWKVFIVEELLYLGVFGKVLCKLYVFYLGSFYNELKVFIMFFVCRFLVIE